MPTSSALPGCTTLILAVRTPRAVARAAANNSPGDHSEPLTQIAPESSLMMKTPPEPPWHHFINLDSCHGTEDSNGTGVRCPHSSESQSPSFLSGLSRDMGWHEGHVTSREEKSRPHCWQVERFGCPPEHDPLRQDRAAVRRSIGMRASCLD